MNRTELAKMLLQIAFLNLRSHKAKTLIVGSIMFFGTMLWTVGSSMVGSVESAMSKTIIDSLSGDLQVYEADTRDELSLFGGGTFGAPDIGEISDFKALKDVLLSVPNVRAVVPQGTTYALLANPSELDDALSDLRIANRDGDVEAEKDASARAQFLIEYLLKDTQSRLKGQTVTPVIQETLDNMNYALSTTFWAEFKQDTIGKLEFLDTKIAPLGTEGALIYMSIMGSDLDQFRKEFPNFQMVSGDFVPSGERGMVMPERFLEQIKNKVAREFDEMKKNVASGMTFAKDEALRDKVTRNVRQFKSLLFNLDPAKRNDLLVALRTELGKPEGDLDSLLREFLQVDDSNFAKRHKFFYDVIAPKVRIYPVKVGDYVTMRAFTRSGYMRSMNIKLYGIFRFKGMEESDLAGAYSMVDIMSFREMYGAATAEQREELKSLKESVGIKDVSRDAAEDSLFGGGEVEFDVKSAGLLEKDPSFSRDVSTAAMKKFSQDDIENGLALHAAVLLKDSSKTQSTMKELQEALKKAEMKMRVVTWQGAAGFVGQMTLAMRAVLIFGMFVIFLVALVVVNNTVIISTLERTNEIGTLRAIGAQRGFILWMFLLETSAIAVVAGVTGAIVGAGLISLMGMSGIPAPSQEVNFLFGGPRLFPAVGAVDMLSGLFIILFVSIAATFFPARAATRVQPVEAMRGSEK